MMRMLYVLAFLFPPLICCTDDGKCNAYSPPIINAHLNNDTAPDVLTLDEFPDNFRMAYGIPSPNGINSITNLSADVWESGGMTCLVNYLDDYYLHTRDTMSSIMLLQGLFAAYQQYSPGEKAIGRRQYDIEKRRLVFWIGALIIIYFISMTGYARTMSNKTRRLEESAAIIEELSRSRNELEAYIANRSEKEERLKELLGSRFDTMKRLANLHYQYEHNPRLLYKKYDEFLGNTIEEEEIATVAYEIVNEKYDGAIARLTARHPSLTKKDIETCCLLCVGFTSQEICSLYRYKDPNTIYVRTYRIREKLGLDQGAKIEDYITGM